MNTRGQRAATYAVGYGFAAVAGGGPLLDRHGIDPLISHRRWCRRDASDEPATRVHTGSSPAYQQAGIGRLLVQLQVFWFLLACLLMASAPWSLLNFFPFTWNRLATVVRSATLAIGVAEVVVDLVRLATVLGQRVRTRIEPVARRHPLGADGWAANNSGLLVPYSWHAATFGAFMPPSNSPLIFRAVSGRGLCTVYMWALGLGGASSGLV